MFDKFDWHSVNGLPINNCPETSNFGFQLLTDKCEWKLYKLRMISSEFKDGIQGQNNSYYMDLVLPNNLDVAVQICNIQIEFRLKIYTYKKYNIFGFICHRSIRLIAFAAEFLARKLSNQNNLNRNSKIIVNIFRWNLNVINLSS